MKIIARSVAITVFALVAVQANAQKEMNDPSYSINNYKHPNKAEYMKKQQDAKPIQYVEEIKDTNNKKEENSLTSSANYKNISASKAKMKKFKKSDEPSIYMAPNISSVGRGNYKSQFQGRQRGTEKPKPTENNDTPLASN